MIGHLLNRTFEVWRASTTADGAGGYTATWSQVATVDARAHTTRNETQNRDGGAPGASVDVTVYVLPDADVQRGDELREGADLVLDVVALVRPSVTSAYLRLECEQRQAEEV